MFLNDWLGLKVERSVHEASGVCSHWNDNEPQIRRHDDGTSSIHELGSGFAVSRLYNSGSKVACTAPWRAVGVPRRALSGKRAAGVPPSALFTYSRLKCL
jgi:hypothetical protein